jgi:hypothetical protein
VRFAFLCIVALCFCHVSAAQNAEQIATLEVRSVQTSYRLGDVPVIELTLKNVSQNVICFGESAMGAFVVELYDLSDKSGADLLSPLKLKHKDETLYSQTMSVCPAIDPGQSVTKTIRLTECTDLITHPGLYKLVVSRWEVENRVKIIGNPVTIEITPK